MEKPVTQETLDDTVSAEDVNEENFEGEEEELSPLSITVDVNEGDEDS